MNTIADSNKSLFKTFLDYAIPSIIAMIVSSLYVMIDGIFVGRGVGANAIAAVNIAFPVTMMITAIVLAVSMGGANLVSIRLGEGKTNEAKNIFSECLVLMIALSIILGIIGTVFVKPLAILFGATDILLNDVITFLRFFFLFGIPFILSIGFQPFVRNDSAPRLVMVSGITGAISTVIFNYIFIFIFKWGIAGSAIASGCGETLALIVLATHFIRKKGVLRLMKPVFLIRDLKKVLSLGFPTMLTELTLSFSTLCFNLVIIKRIGEMGVTAYGIVNYIIPLIIMILMGITMGLQPIISYYHGAKKIDLINRVYRIGIISGLTVSTCAFVILLFSRKIVVSAFNNESAALVSLAATALICFAVGYIPGAVNMVNLTYYQATDKPGVSSTIGVLRGFILIPVGLFFLPYLFGDIGIWLTVLFSELLTFIVTQIIVTVNKNRRKEVLLNNR